MKIPDNLTFEDPACQLAVKKIKSEVTPPQGKAKISESLITKKSASVKTRQRYLDWSYIKTACMMHHGPPHFYDRGNAKDKFHAILEKS
jgi:hypothetical protein